MKAVLLVAFLFLCIKADWSSPKEILGQDTHIKHFSTYLDKSTLKTHIAYCTETTTDDGDTTQALKYALISPANEVVADYEIAIGSGCRVAKIIADGKNLLIAFEGQRDFHLGVCNATNPKGCYDIYKTESQDGGMSWVLPTQVPRKDLSDIGDRMSPSFLLNPITKRLFLFYTQRPITSSETKLAFVTRPPESTIFMTETITKMDTEEKLIAVLSTIDNERLMMHIFTERRGKTIHIFSDNPITWKESEVLDDKYHFSSFVTDPNVMPTVIMGIFTDGKGTFLAASDDHGKTWPEKYIKPVTDKYHRVSAAMVCICAKELDLEFHIIMTSFMQTEQKYVTVKIPSGAVTIEEAPFMGIENYGVFMPQLWCYTSAKTNAPAVKAFSYIWAKPNKPMLYVSDNEAI